MKLSLKDRYFLQENFPDLIKQLNMSIKDTYDDIQKTATQILDTLPTAQQDNRGQIVIVPSAGVDKVYICRLNSGSYEWRDIT